MANKEIIICVDNHRVHFSPELSIPIQHTNIPKKHLTFRSNEKIYWKVEMLEYNGADECLKVRVLQYHSYNTNGFTDQKPKRAITKLLFEKLDWDSLEPLLSFYQKVNLTAVLSEMEKVNFPVINVETTPGNSAPKSFAEINSTPHDAQEAKTTSIETQFWVDFSDIHFRLGYVTCRKKIKGIDEEIECKIINDHILAEFEHIKYWFAKILKTKKIKVAVIITLSGEAVANIQATSEHIDKINPGIIDSVKYQRTHALIKAPKINMPDKSLFTVEDIFNQFEPDHDEGNTFKQNDADLLSFLMDKSSVRNRSQLEYLAGGKQTENNKLRYTLHPNFGFLFMIEGEEKNHFIWELLNSHATYIWSLGKSKQDIALQYKRIEEIINSVRSVGREEYKRDYRNNHQDDDLVFSVLEHDQVNSNFKDGFPKWKSKLNEMLI